MIILQYSEYKGTLSINDVSNAFDNLKEHFPEEEVLVIPDGMSFVQIATKEGIKVIKDLYNQLGEYINYLEEKSQKVEE